MEIDAFAQVETPIDPVPSDLDDIGGCARHSFGGTDSLIHQ